jgi:hypothetical protein
MTPKKKIYFYSAIFGITSLVFIVLVIPYFLSKVRESSESLISLKQELASLQREIDNIQILKIAYQNRKDDLNKIDDIFVDADVPLHFIDFLETNAEVSKQEIDIAFVPSGKEKDEPWSSLSFQLSTTGFFPDFLKFLERLENSPYLIEIVSLNTKGSTSKDFGLPDFSAGTLESSLLIKVFTK